MLSKVVVVLIGFFAVANASVELYSPLVPLPMTLQFSNITVKLDGQFKFNNYGSTNKIINNAIDRYNKLLSLPKNSVGTLKSCIVSVDNLETSAPIVGSDESYQLSVTTGGECKITSLTTWGLLHGLETFSELLVRDENVVKMPYTPVSISDQPRFSHRGLMIDTARHYLSVDSIRGVIDSLPMNK
jgi:hexosaminidase